MGIFIKAVVAAIVILFGYSYIEGWSNFEKFTTIALVFFAYSLDQAMRNREKDSKRLWNAINTLEERLDLINNPARSFDKY